MPPATSQNTPQNAPDFELRPPRLDPKEVQPSLNGMSFQGIQVETRADYPTSAIGLEQGGQLVAAIVNLAEP